MDSNMLRRPLHVLVMAPCAVMILGLSTTTSATAKGVSDIFSGSRVRTLTQATAPTVSQPAPISFVASATRSANLKVSALTVPSAVLAGDTMLLTASLGNATSATVPSGWTLKGDQSATRSLRSLVWVRTATASDAGRSVAVTMDAIHKSALAVNVYRGVDSLQSVSAKVSTDANTAKHTTPKVTVSGNSRVISFWAEKGSSTTRWTTSSAVSLRAHTYSGGTGRVSAAVADPKSAGQGVVGGTTATTDATSARGVNWSIVLPARTTPTPIPTPTPT